MGDTRHDLTPGAADLALSASPGEALDQARQIELFDRDIDEVAVTVVTWPAQAVLLDRLRGQGLPRLLLLDPTTPPIVDDDLLQDWARLPVSIPDLRNRLQRLRRVARDHPARPLLDGEGRLVYRGRWISLSPRQEELAATLVAHFEQPVTTRDLRARTRDQPSNNALRCGIYELRRQVRHLGLDITSIRNHGYLLHA